MTGTEIRQKFIDYFEKHRTHPHRHVRSSSLAPVNDPTLLFTNAGMNQFKDVFLGVERRDYTRAVTSQKCVRAGGKHNDLENVGFTNRHHTFFEMLGNFSFGDYFKKEAIAFAWELITSPEWFGIPKEKLYATIFKGEEGIARDEDAEKFWLETGVPRERIFALGMKDNFWAMGDTGPCGPCSELHYDMGETASEMGHTRLNGTECLFPCDCGRYVEIWNLVFMQFNRDASGALAPLPKPCVDTGMGLERLAAVKQGKISNFETDLFMPLIERAAALSGYEYGSDFKGDASLRVIADHTRAATFLIADGVQPSNEGRGYVLRKVIRRGIRHARLLDFADPLMSRLVATVREEMRDAYPELQETSDRVASVILDEENRFARILTIGWREQEELFGRTIAPLGSEVLNLEKQPPNEEVRNIASLAHTGKGSGIQRMTAILRAAGRPVRLPGDAAFKLTDTFGLPKDFVYESTRDMGFDFDEAGYDRALDDQRARSRASWKGGGGKEAASPVYAKLAEALRTEPVFYEHTKAGDCRIEAIITKQGQVNELPAGAEAEIVLDRTSFYAESGGQQADAGSFFDHGQSQELAIVKSAYYPVSGLVAHRVVAKEALRAGDFVLCVADPVRRERNKRNHTATHLVHAALRATLGTHVKQAGSLVAPDHLRFDFSHFAGVDAEALREIEQQVNEQVLKNAEIETSVTSIDEALASGALAFFGDKYPEKNVRVVTIPDAASPRGFYSKELCGGTHVRRAGDIGVIKIVGEQSVAAGVRRLEAITGDAALSDYQQSVATLCEIAAQLNVGHDGLAAAVERMAQQAKQIEKQLGELKSKGALGQVDELLGRARTVKDVRVVAAKLNQVDRNTMRSVVDTLRQKLGSGVIVLGTSEDGKVALISAVTKDLQPRLHAGKIVQEVAKQVGGAGGGRPDLAEAGGKDVAALETALENVFSVVENML